MMRRSFQLCLLLLSLWAHGGEYPVPTEYQVKAAFLYNFAKFVDWPATAFAQESSPIIFGVAGDDPFGADLEKILDNKKIQSHEVVVKRFGRGEPLEFCHVLFVSQSEGPRVREILQQVKDRPTLTVGDGLRGFLDNNGIINFVMESRKVRFAINREAAERAQLKISSKLLRLAVRVKGEQED